MAISPGPFRMVRYHVPYGDWIMDAESGMVCGLFRRNDENLLLNSRALLEACEAFLASDDAMRITDERYEALKAAVDASREAPDAVSRPAPVSLPAPVSRRRSYALRPAGPQEPPTHVEGEREV